MTQIIHGWLDADRPPGSLYELLGTPLFCQQQGDIDGRLQRALRQTRLLQQDQDAARAAAARKLQQALLDAEAILGDSARRADYDAQLVVVLRRRFHGEQGLAASVIEARRWLTANYRIEPLRLEEIASAVAEPDTTDSRQSDTSEWQNPRVRPVVEPQPVVIGGPGHEDHALNVEPMLTRSPAELSFPNQAEIKTLVPPKRKRIIASPVAPRAHLQQRRVTGSSHSERKRHRQWQWITLGIIGMIILLLLGLNLLVIMVPPPPDSQDTLDHSYSFEGSENDVAAVGANETASTASVMAADGATMPRVGESVEWTGQLEKIIGKYDDQGVPELQVTIRRETSPRRVLLTANSNELPDQLRDYVTREEHNERSGSEDETAGDQVLVRGVVTTAPRTKDGTAAVRLTTIERQGDEGSKITLAGTPRSQTSYRPAATYSALAGILRLPPRKGAEVVVRGRYLETQPSDKTVVVALGPGAVRGAEVIYPEFNASFFTPGMEVEVKAVGPAPTIKAVRIVDSIRVVRPVLIGKDIGWAP